MQVELRRNQDILIVTGMGVIAFAMWDVLKTVLYFFFHRKEFSDTLTDALNEMSVDDPIVASWISDHSIIFSIVFYGFIFIFSLFIFLFRLYLGNHARAEGKGQPQGVGYLWVSGIVIIGHVLSFYLTILSLFDDIDHFMDNLMTAVIDLTSFFVLLQMIVASIKVRIIRDKLARRQSHAA